MKIETDLPDPCCRKSEILTRLTFYPTILLLYNLFILTEMQNNLFVFYRLTRQRFANWQDKVHLGKVGVRLK